MRRWIRYWRCVMMGFDSMDVFILVWAAVFLIVGAAVLDRRKEWGE